MWIAAGIVVAYIAWRTGRSETYIPRMLEAQKDRRWGPRQTRAQMERGAQLATAGGIGMGGFIVLMGVESLFAK